MGKLKESSGLTTSSKTKKKKINGNKKGKAFERQIANELGHIFPDAQRELEFQASNNRGTDIENTDLFQFQCKRYAGYAPIGKINEIKLESPNHIPVLVTQGNRMECMAVLPFSKLVTLIEIAYGLAPRLVHPDMQSRSMPPRYLIENGKLNQPIELTAGKVDYVEVVDHQIELDSII